MVLYYELNKSYDNGTDSWQLVSSNIQQNVIKHQHTPFLSVLHHSHELNIGNMKCEVRTMNCEV